MNRTVETTELGHVIARERENGRLKTIHLARDRNQLPETIVLEQDAKLGREPMNNQHQMEFHELADIFPMLEPDKLAALAADIKAKGLLSAIVTYQGKILDGRNRYDACLLAEVEPKFEEFDDSVISPLDYVISQNLERRHLTDAERAVVAAKIANLKHGQRKDYASAADPPFGVSVTQAEAAERLNVKLRLVQRATKVAKDGIPELQKALDDKKISLSFAAEVAGLPKEDQLAGILKGGDEIQKIAYEIRKAKEDAKREENEAKRIYVPPPEGKYDVIIVDPPWPTKQMYRDIRPNQTGELDYPTMEPEEIDALEIPAADDCHLWLWTTHRFFPDALRILDAWGFNYSNIFTWLKPGGPQPFGKPQYNTEFAIYGRKGTPVFIETKKFSTGFQAPRLGHSVKPIEFYDTIRRVTHGRRLDMFNRRIIPGFVGWGNEAPDNENVKDGQESEGLRGEQ